MKLFKIEIIALVLLVCMSFLYADPQRSRHQNNQMESHVSNTRPTQSSIKSNSTISNSYRRHIHRQRRQADDEDNQENNQEGGNEQESNNGNEQSNSGSENRRHHGRQRQN